MMRERTWKELKRQWRWCQSNDRETGLVKMESEKTQSNSFAFETENL